jgi:uncharacterized integral membrane protein
MKPLVTQGVALPITPGTDTARKETEMPTDHASPSPNGLSRILTSRRGLKTVAWALAALLVAALVLQNREPVQTQLLLVTVEMPQILLLVLAGGLGFVLGLLAPALWKHRRTWPRPHAASQWQDDAAEVRAER